MCHGLPGSAAFPKRFQKQIKNCTYSITKIAGLRTASKRETIKQKPGTNFLLVPGYYVLFYSFIFLPPNIPLSGK